MLLSTLFADLFYLLKANGYSYEHGRSAEMNSFFQKLMQLRENNEVFSKMVEIRNLFVRVPEGNEERLKKDYPDQVDVFLQLFREEYLVASIEDLMELLRAGKKVTNAEIHNLCKANFERLERNPDVS